MAAELLLDNHLFFLNLDIILNCLRFICIVLLVSNSGMVLNYFCFSFFLDLRTLYCILYLFFHLSNKPF